jgi:hypothetical protein
MTLKYLLVAFTLVTISLNIHAQTTLAAGDMAVIGSKTSGDGNGGRDCAKLITFVPLDCDTKFILTDNNWRNTGAWYCDGDEFAVEITITSPVEAGSIFKIDVDNAGDAMTVSTGSATKVGLGNPWGTNYGFNSGGDNCFILQGTRAAPTFIFGFRNSGTFASGGDCSSKNHTTLPPGLTLGTTAIENVNNNRPYYNCAVSSGTKSELLAAICNTSNWANAASSNAGFTNFMSCSPTVTDGGGVYTACGVFLSNVDFILKSSCKNNENELQWYTLNESSNFKQLTLESATSEENFEEIYTLNTSIESNKVYSYKHSNAKKATYYRLRYIDDNGFTKYSDVVAASCKSSSEFSIYPNPAKNSVNVTISYLEKGSDASLIVYNMLGEIVYLTTINSPQQVIINSERFSSGIYYLVLSTEKDKQTQKLVISNN